MVSFKVAVVGGTGFIGDYLVRKLHEESKVLLSVFFRETQPNLRLSNVEYFQIGKAPDSVFRNIDCLVILTQPNLDSLKLLLKKISGVKKIIYASTLLLYPDSQIPVSEESEILSLSDYEKGKADEEKILMDYAKNSDTKLVIARIANVYGDIKNKGVIQKIVNAAETGSDFSVNNEGSQVRDYVFVEDVADYLGSLIKYETQSFFEIFNICTGKGVSINQLLTYLEEITGKKIIRKSGTDVMEKGSIIGDNSKAVEALGFKPKFDIKSGLLKTYQNYLKNT